MNKLNDIVDRLNALADLYSFGGENVTNLEMIIRDLKRIADQQEMMERERVREAIIDIAEELTEEELGHDESKIFLPTTDNNDLTYSDEAVDIFNVHYDRFMELIFGEDYD
jgi:hypothetical protein